MCLIKGLVDVLVKQILVNGGSWSKYLLPRLSSLDVLVLLHEFRIVKQMLYRGKFSWSFTMLVKHLFFDEINKSCLKQAWVHTRYFSLVFEFHLWLGEILYFLPWSPWSQEVNYTDVIDHWVIRRFVLVSRKRLKPMSWLDLVG